MRARKTTLLYWAGSRLARFCFSNFGRLEVSGREAVPPYGPLIVVANHLSLTDPPLLVASLPRPMNFIAKQELFGNPVNRYILKRFNVSPFDRAGQGAGALRLMLRLLGEDGAVAIFPEGHRSPDHSMKAGMLGVVYLALKSQAPILPVGVSGTEKFPVWRVPFPLCRLRVNIGQPFSLPVLEGTPSRPVLESIRDMVMSRIAALLPEEYRGVYAFPAPDPNPTGAKAGKSGQPGGDNGLPAP